MKNATVKSLIILIMTISVSGCGLGQWIDNMGKKLPVYGGEQNRCEGWFCFGGNDDKTLASKKQSPRRKLYSDSERPAVNIPKPTPADKNLATTISDEELYADVPPMPPASAIPPGAPSEPPPSLPYMSGDDMAYDPNFDPELYRPENVEKRQAAAKERAGEIYKDSGLKEHEIYPAWKDELPEGPLGQVRKDIGW